MATFTLDLNDTIRRYADGLAPGKKEARIELSDGAPLSGWLTSPEGLAVAANAALRVHQRATLRVRIEEAL